MSDTKVYEPQIRALLGTATSPGLAAETGNRFDVFTTSIGCVHTSPAKSIRCFHTSTCRPNAKSIGCFHTSPSEEAPFQGRFLVTVFVTRVVRETHKVTRGGDNVIHGGGARVRNGLHAHADQCRAPPPARPCRPIVLF